MPIEKLTPITAWTDQRLDLLKSEYPQCFVDGKVNKELLLEVFGGALEDEAQEHFGLFWPGKREARGLAALPSKGTLIPQPGQGVDDENTHNLFIEGDNLEVLKLLQKSYAGRVKMIYIDPPYNTGNDYVYPDDYSEPLEAYLQRTGQVDETGKILTTNSHASGRFHSNWLNMMYPRLLLSRQLLCNDGVIFISIDDTEVHNLRQVLNEIFGEENFVSTIIWQKKFARQNDAAYFSTMHDYILCYAKTSISVDNENGWVLNLLPRTDDSDSGYSNIDDDPRGPWTSVVLSAKSGSEKLVYKITTPGGRECFPPEGRYWSVNEDKVKELVKDNRIWFGSNGNGIPRHKTFLSEVQSGLRPNTIWFHEEVSHNQEARQYLKTLFDGKAVFDSPKPVELLKQMISIASSKKDEIFMDFFAGSGTLAESIYEKNLEDNGERNFILVQLPEPTIDNEYPTIAEITKERIRRAIKKIKKEQNGKLKLERGTDVGFKVLKLQKSHFAEWESYVGISTTQLELRLGQSETPLVEGWKSENLLTEILLLQGFPLESKVRSLPEFKANEVKQVTSEFVGHHLYVCLDKKVKAETVDKINLRPEDILVCLDSALSDEAKVKLADQCNLKVI